MSVDMKEQIISIRYVDKGKLIAFLRGRFPEPDEFQITTRRGEYYLKLPSLLTPVSLPCCCQITNLCSIFFFEPPVCPSSSCFGDFCIYLVTAGIHSINIPSRTLSYTYPQSFLRTNSLMTFESRFPSNPIPHRSKGKYMDPRQLVSLLRSQYGPSNFSVDLQRDQYIIRIHEGNFHGGYRLTEFGVQKLPPEGWNNEAINTLDKKQYRSLSPIFRRGEHYGLDDLHILPFLDQEANHDGKALAEGGYGQVFRACIHPDNHEFEDSSVRPRRGLFVAVKLLFHNDDFEPERNVYRTLGHLSHDRVIDLLFTYKIKNRYHLVFLWADGSLKDYWEKYPKPVFTHQTLLWSMEQMKGFASGLAYFHEIANPEHEYTRFGRHGDIKPQDILSFRDPNILKIADLRVHGRHSRSNVPPSTVVASPTYSPPEHQRGHPVSRRWDIWSLGCLYLEFVTYLILGNDAIVEFSSRRKGPTEIREMTSDVFYSEDAQEVNPGVIVWVAHLRHSQRCSRAMHDLLDLVMDEMLVVDPDARSSSRQIYKKMKKLIKRAEEEKTYLLKPKPLALGHSRRLPRMFESLLQPQPLSAAPRSHTWNL